MTPGSHHILNLRKNLLTSVGFILSAIIILGGVYLHLSSSRYAQSETLALGKQLSQQASTLARPLMLANDRVSLNYFTNELSHLDHISGIQVQDDNGIIIARAGSSTLLKEQATLKTQDKVLGTITLWLNITPAQTRIKQQLWPVLILSIAALFATLLNILFLCRPKKNDIEESASTESYIPSFSQTLDAHEKDIDPDKNSGQYDAEPSKTPADIKSVLTEELSPKTANTPTAQDKPLSVRKEIETPPLQTQDLVDLLKPERHNEPQIPRFEHHPEAGTEPPLQQEETLILEESPVKASPINEEAENPLFKAEKERNEIQLDLYSFEHELELILPASEATYLIYLDSCTANSENANAEERAQLLGTYHHFAGQVAKIYKGHTELLENGDITICFNMRDEKDNHGTNALCAAILFNLLYKGFNQSRIRSFKPILSLQMSLARGNHNRLNLVEEEAHFLTRTTQSNELISHTALTEAPLLKNKILKDAEIRREDEDKVLILKVTEQHQSLLQKQANHLLTKMFEKR